MTLIWLEFKLLDRITSSLLGDSEAPKSCPHHASEQTLIQSPHWEDRLAFNSPGNFSERWQQGSKLWCCLTAAPELLLMLIH